MDRFTQTIKYIFIIIAIPIYFILMDLSFCFKYSNYTSYTSLLFPKPMKEYYPSLVSFIIFIILLIPLLSIKFNNKYKKYRFLHISLLVGFLFFSIGTLLGVHTVLFKESPQALGDFLKLIGLGIGGIGAIWGLMINNERVKAQSDQAKAALQQVEIAEKAQINTRFKDAVQLLASKETSTIISGVYALHQVAVDSFANSNLSMINVIRNIFITYIQENSSFLYENKQNQYSKNFNILNGSYKCNSQIIQVIIDSLFNKNSQMGEIYWNDGEKFEISDCVFKSLNIDKRTLINLKFTRCYFYDITFYSTLLNNIDIEYSNISECRMQEATINNLRISMNSKIYLLSIMNIKCNKFYISDTIIDKLIVVNIENTSTDIGFDHVKIENSSIAKATMQNFYLDNSIINKCQFSEMEVKGDFSFCGNERIYNTLFGEGMLESDTWNNLDMTNNNMESVAFSEISLNEVKFNNSILKSVDFEDVEFELVDFSNCKIDNNTKFVNTILENYSVDEISSTGRSLELTNKEKVREWKISRN